MPAHRRVRGCVSEREHIHRFQHIGVCMCVCVEVLAHGHVWLQESVWSGACTWVCPCVHVCVKESMVEMHSHGHMCLLVCLHRCLHVGLRWPGPGGMIPGMRSLLCLPAWGREVGTAVALTGDGMGLGCLGLQAHRMQGPLRSTGGT